MQVLFQVRRPSIFSNANVVMISPCSADELSNDSESGQLSRF